MTNNPQVKLFESVQVRSHWSDAEEKWYFSVVDVVHLLSESTNATDYLKKLRKRDPELNLYLGTNCPQVAMKNKDGKTRTILAGSVEHILRIVQAIPSPKAEPFKQWLAKVGYERMQEMADPARSLDKTHAAQNLRDHMSEAELIFTALAELSTRQIAANQGAEGLQENAKASFAGGRVAKRAKDDLEQQTGQKVVTGSNFLPPLRAPSQTQLLETSKKSPAKPKGRKP